MKGGGAIPSMNIQAQLSLDAERPAVRTQPLRTYAEAYFDACVPASGNMIPQTFGSGPGWTVWGMPVAVKGQWGSHQLSA